MTLSSNGGSDTRLDLGRGPVSWPAHRAAPGLPAVSSMLSPREGPRSSRVSLPPFELKGGPVGCSDRGRTEIASTGAPPCSTSPPG
jgi:hypothetical protein